MNRSVVKPLKTILLSAVVMLLASCTLTKDEYNAAVVESMVNVQGNIVATGYAVISVQPHDNPAQQRLLSIRASIELLLFMVLTISDYLRILCMKLRATTYSLRMLLRRITTFTRT